MVRPAKFASQTRGFGPTTLPFSLVLPEGAAYLSGALQIHTKGDKNMSLKKRTIAALIAAAGLAMAQGALAQGKGGGQDIGWYVGGSIGQSEAAGTCPAGFTCDFKDTDWKIFGGYRM